MNSGPTSQRVYRDLKSRILSGHYRPGDRLEPGQLGEVLSSSVTPVRDALHMLTGERLVETGMSEGFHVARIDAPGLEDLYRWNLDVLDIVVRHGPLLPIELKGDYAQSIAQLFAACAARSGNAEHRRILVSLNDRLHAVRLAERVVIEAHWDECRALTAQLAAPDRRSARTALARFHRERVRLAAEIVRVRYRNT